MVIRFLQYYWSRMRADNKLAAQYKHDTDHALSDADRMEDRFMNDTINRSVLVVRPAEPFKLWAAKMGDETLEQMHSSLASDHTAYLIPVQDGLKVDPTLLKAIYTTIFERELLGCCTDQTQWPKPRTQALFRQWFDLELCGLAVDLCDEKGQPA